MSYKFQATSYKNRGFTLIELLVAVALFAIIVDVAAGGFVRALRIQRQTSALLAANSNASLVLEQMFREMRTGKDFILNGPDKIEFINSVPENVVYCRDEDSSGRGVIKRAGGGSACGGGPSTDSQSITAENVNVQYLNFTIFQTSNQPSPGDSYPPRITISLGVSPWGEVGVGENLLKLQTTVSARELD